MQKPVLKVSGLVLFALSTVAMSQYTIDWYTVDGGGGRSTGGAYELTGTIGQPDATAASALTGGGYAVTGGFWAVTFPVCTTFIKPDFDQDCDVDMSDFALFKACATAPDVDYNPAALPSGCTLTVDPQSHIAADMDGDGDVDTDDFGAFQRCISGTAIPADPVCLN